jgi:hypothetical protein
MAIHIPYMYMIIHIAHAHAHASHTLTHMLMHMHVLIPVHSVGKVRASRTGSASAKRTTTASGCLPSAVFALLDRLLGVDRCS